MTQQDITRKVLVIVGAVTGLMPDSISLTDELKKDLHLEDTELLDLENAIEEEFRFSPTLPVFVSDDWKTVQDIITYLEGLQ